MQFATTTPRGTPVTFTLAGDPAEGFPRLEVSLPGGRCFQAFEKAPGVIGLNGSGLLIEITPELDGWLNTGYRPAFRRARTVQALRSAGLPRSLWERGIEALARCAETGGTIEIWNRRGSARMTESEDGEGGECPAAFVYLATPDGIRVQVNKDY